MEKTNGGRKTLRERLHMDQFNFWTSMIFLIIILSLIFIVYPFFKLFIQSFQDPSTNAFTVRNYIKFFQKKYYQEALWHSLFISVVVTVLATALGVPLAYLGTRFNLYFKRAINVMVVISMLSPPFIGAYAWITLLGRNGIITRMLSAIGIELGSIYGLKGIVLVFALKLYPMVYLYVSGALGSIDSSLEEASENLGVAGFARIRRVTLPVILPTVLSSSLMVFMTALADFGTPRLIGEGYTTLPVIIYKEFLNEVGTDTGFASALSVIIVIIAVAVLFVQKRFVDSKRYNMTSLRPPGGGGASGIEKISGDLCGIHCFVPVGPASDHGDHPILHENKRAAVCAGLQPGQLQGCGQQAWAKHHQYFCIRIDRFGNHCFAGAGGFLPDCPEKMLLDQPDRYAADVPLCNPRRGIGHLPDCGL